MQGLWQRGHHRVTRWSQGDGTPATAREHRLRSDEGVLLRVARDCCRYFVSTRQPVWPLQGCPDRLLRACSLPPGIPCENLRPHGLHSCTHVAPVTSDRMHDDVRSLWIGWMPSRNQETFRRGPSGSARSHTSAHRSHPSQLPTGFGRGGSCGAAACPRCRRAG